MKIAFSETAKADIITFLVDEGASLPDQASELDASVDGLLGEALASNGFKGRTGQQVSVVLPASAPFRRAVLIGAGKPGERTARTFETIGANLVKAHATSGFKSLAIDAPDADPEDLARIATGAKLAAYRFDGYFTRQKPDERPSLKEFSLVTAATKPAKAAFKPLDAATDGTFLARDLVNEPPNILHPESFADRVKELEKQGLEVEILNEAAMAELGMNALLGVGQGSARESRLAVMKWSGAKSKTARPVVLVGKGVCFDTGGISLKPGPQMEDMRGDMGGAAAVTGAMLALAKRKARVNAVGLIGLVENMPDGNAQRPGDIITSASGQTIEIQNTDAEGRLVLADVLWYAQKHFKPAALVDLATLTGAVVISLGHEHAGLFTPDDALAEELAAAGEAEGETVWRLPLGDTYDRQLKSRFADMRNIGGRAAGSITAAQFLKRFVDDKVRWAHLDIAGVAWVEGEKKPTDPAWGSGFGPRLLDRWISNTYED